MNKLIELPLNQSVKEQGVIVLAHGGSPQWNNDVLKASRGLADRYPTVVAFGMADAGSIQQAVNTLEGLAVKKIIVIPLFISSHSELYRQTEFLLGLRENPDPDFVEGMHRAMEHPLKFIWKKVSWDNIPYALSMMRNHSSMDFRRRVSHHVPLELRTALDGSQLVGEILEKRAMGLSKNTKEETVLIVAHGPIRDDDDALWLMNMEKLAAFVRKQPFQDVCSATMRDDAPAQIKDKALARMRDLVGGCIAKGDRVIVVPLLLAQGGVEGEIHHILKGMSYVYDEQTLLPDVNIDRWLLESAESTPATHFVNFEMGRAPLQFPLGVTAVSHY